MTTFVFSSSLFNWLAVNDDLIRCTVDVSNNSSVTDIMLLLLWLIIK